VGRNLLHRIIESYPEVRHRVPELRLIVVAGPRIDPASLPHISGVEARGYVPDLYKYLAACDLALVQGGLSTTMELVATSRPFLYFPLRNDFEHGLTAAGAYRPGETGGAAVAARRIAELL
jgi:UDP-N-acetylglucosamine:LPS N-acetylglucosamine transferase